MFHYSFESSFILNNKNFDATATLKLTIINCECQPIRTAYSRVYYILTTESQLKKFYIQPAPDHRFRALSVVSRIYATKTVVHVDANRSMRFRSYDWNTYIWKRISMHGHVFQTGSRKIKILWANYLLTCKYDFLSTAAVHLCWQDIYSKKTITMKYRKTLPADN